MLENRFPHPDSPPPTLRFPQRDGLGGVTFVTALSRGKVTARPLENQRSGGGIDLVAFFYLSL